MYKAKGTLFIKTILTLFFAIFQLQSQETSIKDVELSRFNLWGRFQYKQKLHSNGLGVLGMAGSRYNLSLNKEVNGIEKDAETVDAFLQELWVGPFWGKKIAPNLKFSTNLLYRPQFWYADEAAGKEFYVRHTISNSYNLFHTLKPFTVHYRVMFWEMLENSDQNLDNELITRLLAGITIPFNDKWSFLLKEELFLKLTAEKGDADGEELFNKNAVWTGFTYKPTKKLSLSLQYVNMFTNLRETLSVKDHYLLFHVTFQQGFKPKK